MLRLINKKYSRETLREFECCCILAFDPERLAQPLLVVYQQSECERLTFN